MKTWASIALLGLILGGACTRSDRSPAPSEAVGPVAPTSSTLAEAVGDPLPAATSDLSSLELPSAGVVLGWSSDDSLEGGAVLASLEGELLANVPDALGLIYFGVPGPLVLGAGAKDYMLGNGGRLEEIPINEARRSRLAYGAEVVVRGDGDPAPSDLVQNGEVLAGVGNGMGELSYDVSYDLDMVTVSEGDSAVLFDLRTSTRRVLPTGCRASDRPGDALLLLCGGSDGQADVLQLLDGGRVTPLVRRAESSVGGWRKAMFSNTADTILLEADGPCGQSERSSGAEPIEHQPTVFLADADGTNLRRLDDRDRVEALGWSPDDEAIVAATSTGSCGDPARTGIDAYTPSGSRRRIFTPESGVTIRRASMWLPPVA